MVEPLAPRFLLPGGFHKLWADGETEKKAESLRKLYASEPRLPRLLSPRLFRETLAEGCRQGLFVLRYVRPFGTEDCWWRTEVDDSDLSRDDLTVLPASTATLTHLTPDLLAPSILPELWPNTQIVRYSDLQTYFNGEASVSPHTPKITPEALAAAVREAIKSGVVLARTLTTSYQGEEIPAADVRADTELLPAAKQLSAQDLLPTSLPAVWSNDAAPVSLIADELRAKAGYAMPFPILRDAITQGIHNGLWKIEGIDTLPRDVSTLMALTLKIGGKASSVIVPASPPYSPAPSPQQPVRETPFAERSGMTPVEMNKTLGELVQWQAQHPELSFSFSVTVMLEGTSVDEGTLDSLNEWLRQKRLNLQFEK